MKNMLVVGITGRSGSGKTSVAEYYRGLGHPVADGDVVAREVVQPGSPALAELAAEFGSDILAPGGSLLRKALAAKAFATPAANQRLVQITHPYILRRFVQLAGEAEAAGQPLFFIDGAMILGSIVQPYCDRIIVVAAPHQEAMERIVQRDGISKAQAAQRLLAQLPEEEMRAAADYVIENNGTLPQLLQQATAVLNRLLQKE
ncbi:MAG: dephospho-CoA kinase [Oscillospiraceae bacterium]